MELAAGEQWLLSVVELACFVLCVDTCVCVEAGPQPWVCHFLRNITHLIFFETGSFIGPEVTHWSGWLVNPRAHSDSASQVQGLHVQASGQQSAFLAFYVDAGSQTQSSHMHGKHFPSCVISFLAFSFMFVCLSVSSIYILSVLSLTSKAVLASRTHSANIPRRQARLTGYQCQHM